jgi:hypothetical protein
MPHDGKAIMTDTDACNRFAQELHTITGRFLEGIGEPHHDLWSVARRVVWEWHRPASDNFKLAEALEQLSDLVGRPRTEDEI